jgi:hypothetical protein
VFVFLRYDSVAQSQDEHGLPDVEGVLASHVTQQLRILGVKTNRIRNRMEKTVPSLEKQQQQKQQQIQKKKKKTNDHVPVYLEWELSVCGGELHLVLGGLWKGNAVQAASEPIAFALSRQDIQQHQKE